MTRVVWTKQEQKIIYREMVNLFIQNPDLITVEVLARCQIPLPEERRRNVSYNMVFNYKNRVIKAENEAKKIRLQKTEDVPKVVEQVETSNLHSLIDQLIKQFAKAVADEILKTQPAQFYLTGKTEDKNPVKVKIIPSEKSQEPKIEKPTILIIGLNGHQTSIVRSRFPNKDIMFLGADEAKSQCFVDRQHTILMTKFISHSIQTKYRHASDLKYCNGGVTELGSIITNIR